MITAARPFMIKWLQQHHHSESFYSPPFTHYYFPICYKMLTILHKKLKSKETIEFSISPLKNLSLWFFINKMRAHFAFVCLAFK